jgi:hypothetical protein
LPVTRVMPTRCVLSTFASGARWLAVESLTAAAPWRLLMLEGPPVAHPPNKLVVWLRDLDLESCCCTGALGDAFFMSSSVINDPLQLLSCALRADEAVPNRSTLGRLKSEAEWITVHFAKPQKRALRAPRGAEAGAISNRS